MLKASLNIYAVNSQAKKEFLKKEIIIIIKKICVVPITIRT